MPEKLQVYKPEYAPMVNWMYDLILWSFSILVDLFFREVHPRGAFRIPRRGPVIFVAAPHANQFVDPLILMRTIRMEAHRRLCILVAEKSMRRRFIGWLSRSVGALPVARALDMAKSAPGRVYLADTSTEESRLHIRGIGTKFTEYLTAGGLLVLPPVKGEKGGGASSEVAEVVNDEEVILKKEFKGRSSIEQLTNDGDDGRGCKYKVAPKVDQTQVYDAVFNRLNEGGCVGIFPEGGSHDRTELLPLKAGVAIMALGALAANPTCGLKIVPCGMNYFHAHKFRSRAVIEFGSPIDIPTELVEQYARGERREAVKSLLDMIYNSLVSVTVTSPDYDTLMVIQAVRRLYKPANRKLPLPTVMELNRRLITAYTHYKDDPRIIQLRASVTEYNQQLRLFGLRDHQVEYARFSIMNVVCMLLVRLAKLLIMSIGALPGILLFSPVFVATKIISIRKAKEALKASTVKIQGRDVMATWKLLVALAFAPILYSSYVLLLCIWTYQHRIFGIVPEWVPIWSVAIAGWIIFPAITFAALRFGEVGMDILKSLRPLVLMLRFFPETAATEAMGGRRRNPLELLRERRERLSGEVTEIINTLGPEMFKDFENTRILVGEGVGGGAGAGAGAVAGGVDAEGLRGLYGITYTTASERDGGSGTGAGNSSGGGGFLGVSSIIPRNESFGNLANIQLFASRPASRARSRSNSGRHDFSGGFARLSQLDSGAGGAGEDGASASASGVQPDDAVVRRIGDKLAERRRERARRRSSGGAGGRRRLDGDGEGVEGDGRGRTWEGEEEEEEGTESEREEGSEEGVSMDSEGDVVEVRKRR